MFYVLMLQEWPLGVLSPPWGLLLQDITNFSRPGRLLEEISNASILSGEDVVSCGVGLIATMSCAFGEWQVLGGTQHFSAQANVAGGGKPEQCLVQTDRCLMLIAP